MGGTTHMHINLNRRDTDGETKKRNDDEIGWDSTRREAGTSKEGTEVRTERECDAAKIGYEVVARDASPPLRRGRPRHVKRVRADRAKRGDEARNG